MPKNNNNLSIQKEIKIKFSKSGKVLHIFTHHTKEHA